MYAWLYYYSATWYCSPVMKPVHLPARDNTTDPSHQIATCPRFNIFLWPSSLTGINLCLHRLSFCIMSAYLYTYLRSGLLSLFLYCRHATIFATDHSCLSTPNIRMSPSWVPFAIFTMLPGLLRLTCSSRSIAFHEIAIPCRVDNQQRCGDYFIEAPRYA